MCTVTTAITLCIVALGAWLIASARRIGAVEASVVITVLNSVTPLVVKYITMVRPGGR